MPPAPRALGAPRLVLSPASTVVRPAKTRVASALVEKLDDYAARRPVDETLPELEPELLRRLKELGYVGDDD